jgi:hypothetical protein
MRRYNIISRILLILTVITFALAAPVLVQEKRQACGDKVHVPEDVITVLGKRTREQDLDMLWDGLRYYEHVWGNRNRAGVHLQEPPLLPDVPPPNPAGVHVPEVHVPPQNPADSDRESMELDSDGPPASPESGHSEEWYTPPSSLGSSTESDSDSDRWSTMSNAPSAESQSENLKAADYEMRGKAKVLRHISGTASGVDTVNAAQMELRSAVDPGP